MNFFIVLISLCTLVFANEASYNRGENIYFSKACSSCHGASAEGSTAYPRLANKKSTYLLKKLQYFKKGKVESVSQQMMVQFISHMSEKEIKDLVYFLSNYKEVKTKKIPDDILGGFGS